MRLPIDSEMLTSSLDQQEGDQEEEKIQNLLAIREAAFEKAETNIAAAQKVQKETYDRKHQPEVLPEGTEVLLENTW